MVGSRLNRRAIPEHTPAINRSSRGRVERHVELSFLDVKAILLPLLCSINWRSAVRLLARSGLCSGHKTWLP